MRRGLGMRVTPIGTRARVAAFAGVVGLGVASWPATARGAPFELDWSAPGGCPSHEQIVHATLARLGEAPSEAPPELFVQATVMAERSGGFVVTLAMTDAAGRGLGEREVRVDRGSCSEVEAPTSLVLAMMIAVARPEGELHVEPPATADGRPMPLPRQVSEPPRARPPAPPRLAPPPRRRLVVGAAAVGSTGILPAVGIGAGLRAGYSPGAGVFFALETTFEGSRAVDVAGGEVGFHLFTASARLGLSVLRTTTFEVVPTVGARGALLLTSPSGFSAVHDELRSTMLAGPGVLVRARLARDLFAEALPEVEGVLVRDRFGIREGDKLYHIHRASPIEGRVSLGIAYEFP